MHCKIYSVDYPSTLYNSCKEGVLRYPCNSPLLTKPLTSIPNNSLSYLSSHSLLGAVDLPHTSDIYVKTGLKINYWKTQRRLILGEILYSERDIGVNTRV